MVLFCKGDFKSVYMLLQGIKLFAATTGLKASPSKSDFYSCGLTEKENRRISESSWFKHGNLPFKYLGLPISIKKLSADCEKLIDKRMIRIRIWSTRNISFAGRRQSLNVVLLSINVTGHKFSYSQRLCSSKLIRFLQLFCGQVHVTAPNQAMSAGKMFIDLEVMVGWGLELFYLGIWQSWKTGLGYC